MELKLQVVHFNSETFIALLYLLRGNPLVFMTIQANPSTNPLIFAVPQWCVNIWSLGCTPNLKLVGFELQNTLGPWTEKLEIWESASCHSLL